VTARSEYLALSKQSAKVAAQLAVMHYLGEAAKVAAWDVRAIVRTRSHRLTRYGVQYGWVRTGLTRGLAEQGRPEVEAFGATWQEAVDAFVVQLRERAKGGPR